MVTVANLVVVKIKTTVLISTNLTMIQQTLRWWDGAKGFRLWCKHCQLIQNYLQILRKITKSSCKCTTVAESVKGGKKIKEMHKTSTVNTFCFAWNSHEWMNVWIMVIQHITSWNTGAPYLVTELHLLDSCHVFAPCVLTGLSSQ